MLNTNLGTVEIRNSTPYLRTKIGLAGHALYGPYEYLAPGLYEVAFVIEIPNFEDNYNSDDLIYAVIDVVSNFGANVITRKEFTIKTIDRGELRLEVRFQLSNAEQLEYRLYTTGAIELLVSQNREVKRISSVIIDNYLENDEQRSLYLSREIAELLGFREGRNNLYKAFIGAEDSICVRPEPVPFSSSVCHQRHFALDQYRFWCKQIKERPGFHRKQWEFVYIAQALYERGYLMPGKRGLGFGCGLEPLPALFASFGAQVLATDQDADQALKTGWSQTNQHTYDIDALNARNICESKMFRELVSFRNVDMNDIPSDLDEQVDFCWSSCSLEHLGTLQKGLEFIDSSLKTLRPGGIAVHTTEYNLSSNDSTISEGPVCLYRRKDIAEFLESVDTNRYRISPVDWTLGPGFAEMVVDLPPYTKGEPHIRLKFGNYDVTSMGLIIERLA